MDDDRLATELQRRASGASPRPDWAQRDLLPAVWREVDARPAPVLASRWSPLAGLATLVVALLVLVVAVPRLGPQPPSATSTPANPLVLTTADFAARLAAGELDGKTVLLNGGIVAYDGPPLYGPVCGANGPACLVGQLEGVTPRVVVGIPDIAVASSGDSTEQVSPGWPWWARVAPPVRGTLLLSVDQLGGVKYVGRVLMNGDKPTWSVGDAVALDVNSLERDELVLVDGWLVDTEPPGSFINIDCIPRQFPDLVGLPSRYCQLADYLSSEQPTGELVPDSAAQLQVQRAAAKTFGGRNVNDSATFAIAPRLYGGGCSAAPPCWLWNVVARVDVGQTAVPTPTRAPTSTPAMPTSPSPVPTIAPTELKVFTTGEFAAALGAGGLNGQTVLVNGFVPEVGNGTACSPPPPIFRCVLGVLTGAEPLIQVRYERWAEKENEGAHFEGGDITWPWWGGPQMPVVGTLLLHVTDQREAQFVGLAHDPEPIVVRSVADAKALDINSISLEDVVLVDGWLSGIGGIPSCLPLPTDVVAGLPNRWCSNTGYVSDGPSGGVWNEPDSAPWIELQGNAYWDYAADPRPELAQAGDGEPRFGTYALSPRLEGLCVAVPAPCWKWNLVARVDANPVSPTPTPPASATAFVACEHINSTNADLAAPSFIDLTGLVSSCGSFDTLYSPVGTVIMLQNIDDPVDRILQIAWIGTSCDGDAVVTFARSGARFTVTIDRGAGSQCQSIAVRVIRLNLTYPVDADLIDLTDRAH